MEKREKASGHYLIIKYQTELKLKLTSVPILLHQVRGDAEVGNSKEQPKDFYDCHVDRQMLQTRLTDTISSPGFYLVPSFVKSNQMCK